MQIRIVFTNCMILGIFGVQCEGVGLQSVSPLKSVCSARIMYIVYSIPCVGLGGISPEPSEKSKAHNPTNGTHKPDALIPCALSYSSRKSSLSAGSHCLVYNKLGSM